MKIEVVHNFSGLQQLEKSWRSLQEIACPDNPFLTYEFFSCLAEVFFEKNDWLLVIVKDGDEVVGIAPLMQDGESIRSIHNIHSKYFDFLVKQGNLEVYDQIFVYLLQNQAFASIYLTNLCKNSHMYKYIVNQRRFFYAVIAETSSPVLRISQEWEEYYRTISKNFRENYRKRVNKANRHGGYEYRVCQSRDELDTFLEDLFHIEKNSWKHPVGRSMFSNEQQSQFYAMVAKRFFEHVRIEILYLDGEPAAFWLSLSYAGTTYQLKNSFVESMKNFSPGIILTFECLQARFAEKDKIINYLGVTNSVKSKISNDARVAYDVKLYRKNVKNSVYFFLKYKLWPHIGDNETVQRVKNFLLRRSPGEKLSRKKSQIR